MRGVDFEKLGINGAYALRELHELEQFSELNINRFLPRIEVDRLLEVFDGLLVILRYGPEAACRRNLPRSGSLGWERVRTFKSAGGAEGTEFA